MSLRVADVSAFDSGAAIGRRRYCSSLGAPRRGFRFRAIVSDRPPETPTFVFTDLESSTRLWERFPDEMKVAVDGLVQKLGPEAFVR